MTLQYLTFDNVKHLQYPQYHDIKLYLQIPDFKVEYEKFADEDKCEGFDEMFMSVYDKVVKTWYNVDNDKSPRLASRNYLQPVIVCDSMRKSLCDKYGFKPGDVYSSITDLKNKCNVSFLSQISYWKQMGWIKNIM